MQPKIQGPSASQSLHLHIHSVNGAPVQATEIGEGWICIHTRYWLYGRVYPSVAEDRRIGTHLSIWTSNDKQQQQWHSLVLSCLVLPSLVSYSSKGRACEPRDR